MWKQEKIRKIFLDICLVLYDICSLFTNIPLQETIEIEVELIFENNPQLQVT